MIDVNDFLEKNIAVALVDTSFVRWSKAELISYLNEALSALIIRKPNAFVVREQVSASSNPVELPTDAYSLIAVEQIGGVRGQFTEIETLDRFYPTWREEKGTSRCWTKSADEMTRFWLYPSPDIETNISIQYSRVITANEGGEIDIPIVYEGTLIDYVLYKAFDKDSENASEAQKAMTHYQAFNAALGEKNTTDGALQNNFNLSSKV